jgi:predicted permease
MRQLRAWLQRVTRIVPQQKQEQDFSDEIESHLNMQIEDNLSAGMSPEQARRTAHLKLGGVELAKQAHRERRTLPFLETLLQDLRFSLRQLRRNPGFTVIAILMLSLGIGASVAIFAFVNAALLKPLPYADPNHLVDVAESSVVFPRSNLSYMDYEDWKRTSTVFSSFDAYSSGGFLYRTDSGTEPVPAGRVTSGFFRTLGVRPVLGRDFNENEDQVTAAPTVLLTYATWQKRFGGRKEIVGQTLSFDGTPTTVIGVLPEDFHFAPMGSAEFWTTTHQRSGCEKRRSCHNLYGVARLKPGITASAALNEMKTIARQLEIQYPTSNRDQGASVAPLSELIVRDIRPILIVLLTGSLLLLLISCINVASLLLVRSEGRRREFALRGALGASPSRLLRQFLTEGIVLVFCGSALGLAAGYGAMLILLRLIPKDMLQHMPYMAYLEVNLHVILFAAAVATLAIAVFSITPAIRVPRADLREALNDGDRGSAGTIWRRFGSNLVVVELTIAMILLVVAGLLGKSFYRLLHVELGFDPSHLATVQIALPESSYDKDNKLALVSRKIIDRVAAIPGVTSAASTSVLPVQCNCNTNWIRVLGHPFHGEHNEVNERAVSPDFLKTIGARLTSGRFITTQDDLSRPKVIVINKAFAQRYFPGEDPIGKKIGNTELTADSMREVVGVIDNIQDSSLEQTIWPAEYNPIAQDPSSYYSLLVHTAQDEKSILPQLVAAVHKVDPGIGTYNPTTMQMNISDSPAAYLHRSAAWIVGSFAALALLLGVTGLYGVIAYSVSQRTREIGVRMALGAARGSVYQLILKEAGKLTLIGIVAGILCSVASASLIGKLLFGTRSWDIPTLGSVALLLGLAALLASYIPARRAASINPVEALRAE